MTKKYSTEIRKAALESRRQGKTIKAICLKFGIAPDTLKRWIKESPAFGNKIKRYSEDDKKQILKEYAECRSPKIICAKYHIVKSTLFNWNRASKILARSTGKSYTAQEIYKMERKLNSLQIKNEVLHVCSCSISSSIKEKVAAVEELKGKYTIYALCQALKLSRATYYRVSLNKKKKTIYEQTDDALRSIIQTAFNDSGERFGPRMIKVKLNDQGIKVSKEHIQRLMKEMNLVCKQNRPRCFNSTHRKYKYRRNRLQRNFTQAEPNKFWVSDITYARVNDEFYGVCVVIDLFSRKVLSYGTSPEMNTELVLNTFSKAFEARKSPEGLTFHSDQGAQYTAYRFRKMLRDSGVRQSLSNPGIPHDNAVAEAFFSILKREELSHNWYNTPESLDETVREYIEFFNSHRPHRKLKLQTPDQFERAYWENNITPQV